MLPSQKTTCEIIVETGVWDYGKEKNCGIDRKRNKIVSRQNEHNDKAR